MSQAICCVLSAALATMPSYAPNYEVMLSGDGEVQRVLERLRASLKRRGAEGIRGLARHFKVSEHILGKCCALCVMCCAPSMPMR